MKQSQRKAAMNSQEKQDPLPNDPLGTGSFKVPGDPPTKGEIIAIPTEGRSVLTGAMSYVAILAYPGRQEWPLRAAFFDASRAWYLKRAIKRGYPRKNVLRSYTSVTNKKIDQTLFKGFSRIQKRRVPAAMAANAIILDGVSFGPFNFPIEGVPGGIPVGGMTINSPNNVNRAMRYIMRMIEKRDGISRDEKSLLDNIYHRVWADTLPVLHLAMPVAERMNELFKEENEIRLFSDPSWLPLAIFYAEFYLAGILPKKIPYDPKKDQGFNPNQAVQLFPKEGWDNFRASLPTTSVRISKKS